MAACSASSTRCFFSFISVSVAAPTLTTATTPPESLANRSWSFSRSKSESVFSISDLSWLIRALMASASPAPSMIVVESLSTTTFRARPSCESWSQVDGDGLQDRIGHQLSERGRCTHDNLVRGAHPGEIQTSDFFKRNVHQLVHPTLRPLWIA